MATAIVLIVIGGLFILALVKTIKARKKGGCGSCSGCTVQKSCKDFKNQK